MKSGESIEETKKRSGAKVATLPQPARVEWTPMQDNFLDSLAQKLKGQNWNEVSRVMCQKFADPGYTPKRCRTRWRNCINPNISKGCLRDAEELLIIIHHSAHKNDWSSTAKKLPYRNANVLRNNFYGVMRRVVHRAALKRMMTKEVKPLYFVQTLYAIMFALELLKLTNAPPQKNIIVPVYVYKRVINSGVTQELCLNYLEMVKVKLLAEHPSRRELQALHDYTYQMMSTQFFERLIAVVKQNVEYDSIISDEYMLDMIERAISLCSSAARREVLSTQATTSMAHSSRNMEAAQSQLVAQATTQPPTYLMANPQTNPVFINAPYYQIQVPQIIPTYYPSLVLPPGYSISGCIQPEFNHQPYVHHI